MSAAKKEAAPGEGRHSALLDGNKTSLIRSAPDVKTYRAVRWPPVIFESGLGIVRALAERQAHLGHVRSMLEYMAVEARLRQAADHV